MIRRYINQAQQTSLSQVNLVKLQLWTLITNQFNKYTVTSVTAFSVPHTDGFQHILTNPYNGTYKHLLRSWPETRGTTHCACASQVRSDKTKLFCHSCVKHWAVWSISQGNCTLYCTSRVRNGCKLTYPITPLVPRNVLVDLYQKYKTESYTWINILIDNLPWVRLFLLTEDSSIIKLCNNICVYD